MPDTQAVREYTSSTSHGIPPSSLAESKDKLKSTCIPHLIFMYYLTKQTPKLTFNLLSFFMLTFYCFHRLYMFTCKMFLPLFVSFFEAIILFSFVYRYFLFWCLSAAYLSCTHHNSVFLVQYSLNLYKLILDYFKLRWFHANSCTTS